MDGGVDEADRVGLTLGLGLTAEALRLGELSHSERLTLGVEDLALSHCLGREDLGLALALGAGDRGFPLTVGLGDRGATRPLGLHLLVHGAHHIGRWVDALNLHPLDAHAPSVGGIVEDAAQARVDGVARGERLVELEIADEVAEVRLRQLRHGDDEARDVVDEPLRIDGLVIDDRVDAHHHVVGGDHLLRGHVDDLLSHVDQHHPIDERHQKTKTGFGGGLEPAKALDDAALVGPHDLDAEREIDDEQHEDGDEHDERHHGVSLPSVVDSEGTTTTEVPRTSITRTAVPVVTADWSADSARHSSRPIRTSPTPVGPAGIPNNRTPSAPIKRRAPMPSEVPSASRRRRRGMSATAPTIETTRKRIHWTAIPAPAKAEIEAASAPAANGNMKKVPAMKISAPANPPATSNQTHRQVSGSSTWPTYQTPSRRGRG